MRCAVGDGLLQAFDDVDVGLGVVKVPRPGFGRLGILDFGSRSSSWQERTACVLILENILVEVQRILLGFGLTLWDGSRLTILPIKATIILVLGAILCKVLIEEITTARNVKLCEPRTILDRCVLFAAWSTHSTLPAFQALPRLRYVLANELIEPLMIEFDGVGVVTTIVSHLFVASACLFVEDRLCRMPLLRQSLSSVEYSLVRLSLDFLLDGLAWYVSPLRIRVGLLVLLFVAIQSTTRRVLARACSVQGLLVRFEQLLLFFHSMLEGNVAKNLVDFGRLALCCVGCLLDP